MLPVKGVDNFRITQRSAYFVELAVERVVDLSVQDNVAEVALGTTVLTWRSSCNAESVLFFFSSLLIILQYCQSLSTSGRSVCSTLEPTQ